MIDLTNSFSSIQEDLRSKKYTCHSLVKAYLEQLYLHQPRTNAYVSVFEESALAKADRIDAKIAKNESLGSLFGLVISIKNNICYAYHDSSAASKILEGYQSPFSATAVQRLLDQDAIIIGSTNCDEFGMGSSSTNSVFGPVANGADNTKIAGGSSGGAAVSVQTNTCMVALGSDTGGSVRQPAAMCDVLGFKPSYGSISRHGLIAYASSFDVIGFLAKDMQVINQCFAIAAGTDGFDSTCIDYTDNEISKIATLPTFATFEGIFEGQFLGESLEAMRIFSKNNLTLIPFEWLDQLIPCYYILTTAEASSNLARYDGIRYGYRSPNASNLHQHYTKTRSEGFGKEVKKRILLGTFVLSEGYFDAYYTQAQRIRRKIVEALEAIFENHDFLLLPTTTSPPWTIGDTNMDDMAIYLADVFTVLANLSGMPCISVPITLPSGAIRSVQIMAKKGQDKALLHFVNQNQSSL